MEVVGIFYGHLVSFTAIWYMYFVAIWNILGLFGFFPPFWHAAPRKIWQPCSSEHPGVAIVRERATGNLLLSCCRISF
jgi:hypothetical protein